MSSFLAPAVFVALSVPAFVVARLLARGKPDIGGLDSTRVADKAALARRLSRSMSMIGLSILASALGMFWAGDDGARVAWVVIVLTVAVNGCIVAMLLMVAAAKRAHVADRR